MADVEAQKSVEADPILPHKRKRYLVYRTVRAAHRFAVRIWFRHLEVRGAENIPPTGAAVFAGNHPNHLFDPLMLTTQVPRIVHFAAVDYLFKGFLGPILLALGAVPIKRHKEHAGEGKLDNSGAFEALENVLKTGHTIGIFPEGLGHTEAHVLDLKTGTARIAFAAATAHGEGAPVIPVRIVPVGLNYLNRDKFRSSAMVQFGEPVTIDEEWVRQFREDSRKACHGIMDEVRNRLVHLTMNAPDWDTMQTIHTCRRLFVKDDVRLEPHQYVELTRRFADGYTANKDKPEVKKLMNEVSAYQEELSNLGVRDWEVRSKDIGLGRALLATLERLLLVAVFLPLALPGLILHLPMILLAVFYASRTKDWDVKASRKMYTGLLTTPIFWIIYSVLGSRYLPGLADEYLGIGGDPWMYGVGVLLMLPILGYAAIRMMTLEATLFKTIFSAWRQVFLRSQVRVLREERKRLVKEVRHVVRMYAPPDLEPAEMTKKKPNVLMSALTPRGRRSSKGSRKSKSSKGSKGSKGKKKEKSSAPSVPAPPSELEGWLFIEDKRRFASLSGGELAWYSGTSAKAGEKLYSVTLEHVIDVRVSHDDTGIDDGFVWVVVTNEKQANGDAAAPLRFACPDDETRAKWVAAVAAAAGTGTHDA